MILLKKNLNRADSIIAKYILNLTEKTHGWKYEDVLHNTLYRKDQLGFEQWSKEVMKIKIHYVITYLVFKGYLNTVNGNLKPNKRKGKRMKYVY